MLPCRASQLLVASFRSSATVVERTSLNLSLERHGELVVLGDKKGQEHAMKECKSLLSLIGKVG